MRTFRQGAEGYVGDRGTAGGDEFDVLTGCGQASCEIADDGLRAAELPIAERSDQGGDDGDVHGPSTAHIRAHGRHGRRLRLLDRGVLDRRVATSGPEIAVAGRPVARRRLARGEP